jgi:DNA-binding CsgD family transcriptional regulator
MEIRLSEMERGVLRQAARGASAEESAARLGMSAAAVRACLGRIIVALSARSKLEAVVMAVRLGLLDLDDLDDAGCRGATRPDDGGLPAPWDAADGPAHGHMRH